MARAGVLLLAWLALRDAVAPLRLLIFTSAHARLAVLLKLPGLRLLVRRQQREHLVADTRLLHGRICLGQ